MYSFNPFTGNFDYYIADHGYLLGLTDDDHTQYLKLLGRTGGQSAYGGTAADDNCWLFNSAHATPTGHTISRNRTFVGDFNTYEATFGSVPTNNILTVYGTAEEHRVGSLIMKPTGTSVLWNNYGYNGGVGSINFYSANGVDGAETSKAINETLTAYRVYGYHSNGSAYVQGAEMCFEVDAAIGATAEMPTRFVIALTADGATTPTQAFRLGNNGYLRLGSTNSAASEKLHVEGNVQIGTGTGNSSIRFDSTADGLLTWDVANTEFDFSHDINVTGGATLAGYLTVDAPTANQITFNGSTNDRTSDLVVNNFDANASNISAYNTTVTLVDDLDNVAAYEANIAGYSAGSAGDGVYACFSASAVGDAQDTLVSYAHFWARAFTKNGGTSEAIGLAIDENYDWSISSASGAVEFYLGAAQSFTLDGTAANRTADLFITNIGVGADTLNGFNTTVVLEGDYSYNNTLTTITGYSAGGTTGQTIVGNKYVLVGDAQDTDVAYIASLAESFTANGGSGVGLAYLVGEGFAVAFSSKGGSSSFDLGASETFSIDASTTSHTDTTGAFKVSLASSTTGVFGQTISVTSDGLTSNGDYLVGIGVSLTGNASDVDDSVGAPSMLVAYGAGDYTSNGGGAIPIAYQVGLNYELAMLMYSGEIAWADTNGYISSFRFSAGAGNGISISGGDAYATDATSYTGGNLSIRAGAGVNGGQDGYVKVGAGLYTPANSLDDDDLIVVGLLEVGDDIHVLDSNNYYSGTGNDMGMYYDGTNGNIDTDLVAPSDLYIDCGTDKTIVLEETVWDDMQFSVATGKVPAANFPSWEALTTNTYGYAFGVDELIDLEANEPSHGWKEGTNGSVHIHFAPKTAQSSGANRFVKFTVYISYADVNEVWTETSVTAEYTIPTGTSAKTHLLLTTGTLTLTNNLIGTQLTARVKRIAATGGTEYADDVFITQVGIHLEHDTVGSRSVSTK